jgi:hypothetical protein
MSFENAQQEEEFKALINCNNVVFDPVSSIIKIAGKGIFTRWREAEPFILKYGRAMDIWDYAQNIIRERWPEGEAKLLASDDVYSIVMYAKKVIKGEWPEAEKKFLEEGSSFGCCFYAQKVRKKRWKEAEPVILSDLSRAVNYVGYIRKKRWKKMERLILESVDGNIAYRYVQHGLNRKGRPRPKVLWPEGVPLIAQSTDAYWYCRLILGSRPFPEGEEAIMKDPFQAMAYAQHVLNRRWPECEPYLELEEEGRYRKQYYEYVRGQILRRFYSDYEQQYRPDKFSIHKSGDEFFEAFMDEGDDELHLEVGLDFQKYLDKYQPFHDEVYSDQVICSFCRGADGSSYTSEEMPIELIVFET